MATKSSSRPSGPASRPPAGRSGSSSRPAAGATRAGSTPTEAGSSSARAGSTPARRGAEEGEPAKKGIRGFAARTATNFRQIGQAYRLTVRSDRRLPFWLAGTFLVALLVVVGVGTLIGAPAYFAVIGVVIGILAALIVFGRRAERAAYAQMEGRPGAAAAALDTLKRGWTVTPAVAGTRTLEVVHRAVGRPGIVLVGEGSSRGRVAGLLQTETRRHQRVAPGTPVLTVQTGTGDGQVRIGALPRYVRKLAPVLTPGDVREVNQRLKALRLGPPQTPHGPLPRGARLPKGLRTPADADPAARR